MSHMGLHLSLPSTMAAVALARDTVTGALRGWGHTDPAWLDVVALIVTELVSNAVRHADGRTVLDLDTDGRTTVTVTDGSATGPHLRHADARGGRGLLIVDALSARWGMHEHGTGKQVWAELPTDHRRSRDLGLVR